MSDNINLETVLVDHSIDVEEEKQIDDILKEKLESAYHKQNSYVDMHSIAKVATEHTAIDLAYAATHLPRHIRPVLLDNLTDITSKIAFIVNTDSDTRAIIFRYMNEKDVQKLFSKMTNDEIIKVLEDMSERRFKRAMELVDVKRAMKIREIIKHDRNSAGRLMTSDFFAFDMNITIKQASQVIRDNPRIDFVKGIYVLNENQELIGYVPSRNLLVNAMNTTLKRIMRQIEHKIDVNASREKVVDIVEKYKLSSLPVVDENNKLLGVIPNEEVIEAMEDLADSRLGQIGGTIETLFEPILKRFLSRSPWLFVTLIAGLVNFSVMSAFDQHGGKLLTFILFFVPLITGMSGNIGIQCSTVLVRSMALGMLGSSRRKEAMIKEFSIGLFSGAFFGVVVGLLVYVIHMLFFPHGVLSSFALGTMVSMGLIGACFAGTFLGVLSPLFFSRIGVDPAVASGPIVTAFNDFLSMSIYFIISWGLAHLFIA